MASEPADDPIRDLRPLQWEQRVLLLFADDKERLPLLDELRSRAPEITEREIAWFIIAEERLDTNFKKPLGGQFADSLRKRYRTEKDGLEVVLIGKDGGVKARYPQLDLPAVFARIDSMPMRQAEMRRQSGKR